MGMNDMIQFIRQMSGKLGSNIYAGVQGQTSPQHISFLRQLQREMKEKNSLDSPLEDLKVVVFDLETTGFFPDKGDRIISIGAVKMTGSLIEDEQTFYSLVKSNLPLSEEIASLTNITDKQLSMAPDASEVLIQFFKFIRSRILVAHHSNHEKAFMQKMTKDLMRTNFKHRIIDTSFLIRLAYPLNKSLPLEQICLQCGVEVKNRHHALGDAFMTAQIWSHYLRKAQSMGFKNLREVYEHLAILK
jgi:DNA polymerase III subunit epsilon